MDFYAHAPQARETEQGVAVRRELLVHREPLHEPVEAMQRELMSSIAVMMSLAMTTATQKRMSCRYSGFTRVHLLLVMARTRQIVTIRVIVRVDEGIFHWDDDCCVYLHLVIAHVLTHRFLPPFDTSRLGEQ